MASSGRTRGDDTLAVALAAGKTVADAAEAAGVSLRTAYRRREHPEFRDRIAQIRAEMMGCAVGRLADGAKDAAATLTGLLTSQSETVRLRASTELLRLALDAVELAELRKQVEELTKRLGSGVPA